MMSDDELIKLLDQNAQLKRWLWMTGIAAAMLFYGSYKESPNNSPAHATHANDSQVQKKPANKNPHVVDETPAPSNSQADRSSGEWRRFGETYKPPYAARPLITPPAPPLYYSVPARKHKSPFRWMRKLWPFHRHRKVINGSY